MRTTSLQWMPTSILLPESGRYVLAMPEEIGDTMPRVMWLDRRNDWIQLADLDGSHHSDDEVHPPFQWAYIDQAIGAIAPIQ